ncbi:sigma-70 family RNA polymerase sigma factor [candidate division KSB1 bacterium]|nr:sigma-70 family RNA polymerase sigma factor [candidate division KSB1 bacterium]
MINFQILLRQWQLHLGTQNQDQVRQDLFAKIWKDYYKRLFFFIRHLVGVEAEDLLQEIMFKVYDNLERYNPIYSFDTWIYTIARNHCLNYLDKKKLATQSIENVTSKGIDFNNPDTPESNYFHQELFEKIDDFLNRLDPDYRQMAFLRFNEGLSIKTIAKILDVPQGTVKSRLHLIKQDLKRKLEDEDAN